MVTVKCMVRDGKGLWKVSYRPATVAFHPVQSMSLDDALFTPVNFIRRRAA